MGISRKDARMSPAGINIYVRSMNSFFSWMKVEGHIAEALVLKQLRHVLKPVTVLSDEDTNTEAKSIAPTNHRGEFQ